jgi:hypothetical protein
VPPIVDTKEEIAVMDVRRLDPITRTLNTLSSRRVALRRLVTAAAGTVVAGRSLTTATAQEATPAADTCVAFAPPLDASGIGFAELLVGGIVPDMPAGPVEVRISRLAMAPGTLLEAEAAPYPFLMYIETGTTACPGGAGRVGYGPDGTVIGVTETDGIQYTPAGATQYVPANVPDGAGNEEDVLMSSIVIGFVPVEDGATPVG